VVKEEYKERKSIHVFIEAAIGEIKTKKIYTVSPGKKFKLERVRVFFDAGTNFELKVAIFRGLEQVKPTDGTYRGNNNTVIDTTAVWFGTGETIRVWWQNLSTTEVKRCTLLLEGYEE